MILASKSNRKWLADGRGYRVSCAGKLEQRGDFVGDFVIDDGGQCRGVLIGRQVAERGEVGFDAAPLVGGHGPQRVPGARALIQFALTPERR